MSGSINCSSIMLDESTDIPKPVRGNYVIYSDENDGRIKLKFSNDRTVVLAECKTILTFKELCFCAPLKGIATMPYYLLGNESQLATKLTTNDKITRATYGHHIQINVTKLTGTGKVTITGAKINPITKTVDEQGMESFIIDEICSYFTINKWYNIISIIFDSDIKEIEYDINLLNYFNKDATNIEIVGVNIDITRTPSSTFRLKSRKILQLEIYKIKDNGNNKFNKQIIEDITIEKYKLTDNLRTGEHNRGVTALFLDNTIPNTLTFDDYISYFKSTENYIDSCNKNEGIIIKLTWETIDVVNLLLKYRPI